MSVPDPDPSPKSELGGWAIGCGPPLLFILSMIVGLPNDIHLSSVGGVIQALAYGSFAVLFGTFGWTCLRLCYSFVREGDWGKVVGSAFVALALLGAAMASVDNMGGEITPLVDPDDPGAHRP